ncbi:MAG: hypothetical protein EOM37_06625 [Proteobacteria bacterium]|jgi:hypothetical protein|nr:hypothetical protein [Alphaproteobacteria bacterium]NCC03702.1 hypothetical protein [Pseudomonadota bacterium]
MATDNFKGKKTPEAIIRLVAREITRLGVHAFDYNGRNVLYTGPDESYWNGGDKNKEIAERFVSEWCARWFEGSEIGKYVFEGFSVYTLFNGLYGKRTRKSNNAIGKVSKYASRRFIKAAFGEVATAVCGANKKRVFYDAELPVLVKNTKITTINGLPRELVKAFYDINRDEAYQLICWAELLEAKRKADRTGAKQDRQEYEARLHFFTEERKDVASTMKKHSPAWEAKRMEERRSLLAAYGHETLLDDIKAFTPTIASFPRRSRSALVS